MTVKGGKQQVSFLHEKLNIIFAKGKGRFNFSAAGVALFIFFIFTQRWFELYLQVRFYQVAVVGLALLLIAVAVFDKQNSFKKLTLIDYLWFPAIAVIMTNIFLVDYTAYLSYLFFYAAGFAFLVLAKVNISDYAGSFSLIKGAALVYAFGSITQYFFTDSFNQFIFNFTTDYSRESIDRLVRRNYYPGFGFGRTPIAAGYIAMALGLIMSLWEKGMKKLQVHGNLVIVVVLLFGLLITGKRSILLWVLLALPLTYFVLGQGKEKWLRAVKVVGLLLLAFGTLVAFLLVIDTPPFLARVENLLRNVLTGGVPSSVEVRFGLYQFAWSLFMESPLFGIGWLQFELLAPRQFQVHNVYLQLLTEMGIIGFTVVMVPIIYTYGATYKAMMRLLSMLPNPLQASDRLWIRGLTFSFYYQTFYLLYCLSDNPFYELIFTLFYFVAISMVSSFLVHERSNLMRFKALSGDRVT